MWSSSIRASGFPMAGREASCFASPWMVRSSGPRTSWIPKLKCCRTISRTPDTSRSGRHDDAAQAAHSVGAWANIDGDVGPVRVAEVDFIFAGLQVRRLEAAVLAGEGLDRRGAG